MGHKAVIRDKQSQTRGLIVVVLVLLAIAIGQTQAAQCIGATNPIASQNFMAGDVVDCYQTQDINLGPAVTADNGATLVLASPAVHLSGVLAIRNGAVLSISNAVGDPNRVIGPLAGAQIEAFQLTDLSVPVETSSTMSLSTQNFAGRFFLSLAGIPDDEWILVAATGGEDLDADDDGIADTLPTLNQGVLYGLAKAAEWRAGQVRISLLSDLVWRYTRNLVDKVPPAELNIRLEDLANQLLQADLNGDGILDHKDIFGFDPTSTAHKALLNFDYQRLFTANTDGNSVAQAALQGNEALLLTLLEKEFGHTLVLPVAPDSRYHSVKVELLLAGKGRAESPGNNLLVDSDLDIAQQQPRNYFPRDVAQSLTFTATPKSGMEVVGWIGCDSVSADKSQCTITLGKNRKIAAEFAYTSSGGGLQVHDISAATITLYPDVLDVVVDSGDTSMITLMDQLATGDYIVGSTGTGFLRKIVTITKIANLKYRITTVNAGLDEVVGTGSAILKRSLTHADLKGYSAPVGSKSATVSPSTLKSNGPGIQLIPSADPDDKVFRLKLGNPVSTSTDQNRQSTQQELKLGNNLDFYIIKTPQGEIKVNGWIEMSVDVDFGANFCGLSCAEHVHFITSANFKDNLDFTFTGSLPIFDKEYKVATLKFAKIRFQIGLVPIWISPEVDVYVGVSGEITVEWDYNFSAHADVEAGVIFNQASGTELVWNHDFGIDVTAAPAQLAGEMKVPYVEVKGKFIIYETTGPEISTKVYHKVKVETTKWQTDGCGNVSNIYQYLGLSLELLWSLEDNYLTKLFNINAKEWHFGPKYEWEKLLEPPWWPSGCEASTFLKVEGASISLDTVQNNGNIFQTDYVLTNTGNVSLPWRVEYVPDAAISVSPVTGTLLPGNSTTVTVQLDTTNFVPGVYRNDLAFINAYDETLPDSETGTTQKTIHVDVAAELTIAPVVSSATYPGPGRAKINWNFDPASAAVPWDGYEIQASFDNGINWVPYYALMNITAQTATVSGLPKGVVLFRMNAYAGNARTPVSNTVAVTIVDAGIPPVTGTTLNDTGITWGGDYPDGNNSTCTSNINAPQDCHQGRDATHNDDSDGHGGFSFTKLDASGNPLPASASSWSCVKDNVTGLVWEVKTDDGGLHDRDDRYNWYNTDSSTNGGHPGYADDDGDICHGYDSGDPASYCNTQAYVARVNQAGWCGAHDWRLPSREELRSLVNYAVPYPGPTIDTNYFPNEAGSLVWSSSPRAGYSNIVWLLSFGSGYDYSHNESHHYWVRLVRGGQ
jgi:hypothetical protein